MNLSELKNRMTDTIMAADAVRAYEYLVDFHNQGGEQFDAYEILKELRRTSGLNEELTLDLLDTVSGWCDPKRRIWKQKFGTRVCLCTVDAIEYFESWQDLLPGVTQSRIREYNLGWVKKGITLELRRPDNTTTLTSLENYYVRASSYPATKIRIHDGSIVLRIARSEPVPIGTRVWSIRSS